MHHRRVLLFRLRSVVTSCGGSEGLLKATHAPHSSPPKGSKGVTDVHVVISVLGEEMLEWAAAAEKLGEHGVRVSVEAVAVALTTVSCGTTIGCAL